MASTDQDGWVYSGLGQVRPGPYGGFSVSMCTSLLPGTTFILDQNFSDGNFEGENGAMGGSKPVRIENIIEMFWNGNVQTWNKSGTKWNEIK